MRQTPHTIARKLAGAIDTHRNQKAIDLAAFRAGRKQAHDILKTVVSDEKLAGRHPAHAIYGYVQNRMSALVETLIALPEMAEFADMIAEADETYRPEGPPWSPLTMSYFWYWSVFDAAVGIDLETPGSCILEVGPGLGIDSQFLHIVEVLHKSRMGLYVPWENARDAGRRDHQDTRGERVCLRELITDTRLSCFVPAGYKGRKGETWLARVLPPPLPQFHDHIVLTTPYVISVPPETGWLAYLQRNLPKTGLENHKEAYSHLMKYGLQLNYWNEYIFQAYSNYQTSAVFLTGIPDVPQSRPHSRLGRLKFDGLDGG